MPQRSVRSIIENQNLLTASPETTVAEAAGLMKRSRVGAIMVVAVSILAAVTLLRPQRSSSRQNASADASQASSPSATRSSASSRKAAIRRRPASPM